MHEYENILMAIEDAILAIVFYDNLAGARIIIASARMDLDYVPEPFREKLEKKMNLLFKEAI